MDGVNGNIAEKTGRQIFAKIPGVFVHDMDGSGNRVNISTRGLDPHRSWEYNIRQNGIITNSDMCTATLPAITARRWNPSSG